MAIIKDHVSVIHLALGFYNTQILKEGRREVLAGLKRIVVRVRQRRKNKKNKKTSTPPNKFMDILHKMIFPVRRVWLALSSRLKPRKNGAGLLKLQDDVQTCGYQDVKVMWEMLQRTESEVIENQHKRKQLPFWRIFVWSNHNELSSESANHT
ncbi:hypothetical protein VNO77_29486 [Canavalia gladiata]|uniref:Uncharacterized protein n=1 Tax=Canavalia gladiata TaxID=3824 RepID=A0AAN9Q8B7_CANGL